MINHTKQLILSLAIMLSSYGILAQQRTVTGTVYTATDNVPLPGVSVTIKNTSRGTTTDFDGVFSIQASLSDVLEFSYIGFETQEVALGRTNNLTITLQEAISALEEIVVVGYGTQRKKEVTGAVSVVDAKNIEKLNPTRIEQALQGQVSGVNITSSSGSPGSGLNIRIRGISTNGDNRPLILVDGNFIEDLSVINPNDIKSINVLKDATAGIYGVRAANGVILIETKTGRKESELKFTLDTYAGFQKTSKKLDLLSAKDFAQYVNEAGGKNKYFINPTSGEIFEPKNPTLPLSNNNWQNSVFENAPIQSINFGAKGGTKKLAYAFGASYLNQNGIVGGSKSNYNRLTARTSLQYDITDKFSLSATAIYTYSKKNNLAENGANSVLYNAINADPLAPVKDSTPLNDLGFEELRGGFGIVNTSAIEVANPVAQIYNTHNNSIVNKISPTFKATYDITNKFTVESKYQFNHATVNSEIFEPLAYYGIGKQLNKETNNRFIVNNDVYDDYTWNNLLTYTDVIGENHNIKVLLGQEILEIKGTFDGEVGTNLKDGKNTIGDASIANSENVEQRFQPNQLERGANTFKNRLLSYFTRLQYNYKDKYLFSGVLRRDSSSRFATNNNVGFFPSASLGWVISEESFFQNQSWISSLKVRASYGIIGNDRIADFSYISRLDGEGDYSNNEELSIEDLLRGVAVGRLSNATLQWEKQITGNIGVDLGLWDNKLKISIDAYSKETEDLLVDLRVSALAGASAPGGYPPFINAGQVRNQGLEFLVSYADNIGEDFKFNTSFNFSTLKNEVLRVNSENGVLEDGGHFGIGLGRDIISRMEAGFPIGYFYGYKTDGIYQNQAEIDALDASAPADAPVNGIYHKGAGVGDLKFVDVNGDGYIDENDKTNIGDPIPDFTMGFNFGFTYKHFDFSSSAYASLGNEMVKNYERVNLLANKNTSILDRWTGEGTSNSIPKVTSGESINTDYFSSYYVEDASFLRIQNIQLGYTFADRFNSKIGVDKLRVYVSANNVFTLTNYSGYDPSASSGEPIGSGIDRGFYPVATTYLLGVNLKF